MRTAMNGYPTRRRALRIIAAAAGVGALGAGVRAVAPRPKLIRWEGEVLGAPAEIAVWSVDDPSGRRLLRKAQAEVARHQRIFSLFDPESEIARLNRDGALDDASIELRRALAFCRELSTRSAGAFDVTVQTIWRVYEAHFWSHADDGSDVAARALETARALVDYRRVETDGSRVRLARPGMAITLNGVAQGFVTDAVADLLRGEGCESAFVDLGEMRALGGSPDGRAWRVGLKNPRRPTAFDRTVDMADGALAVSGGYGTVFEPTGRFHHIFDPATGASASRLVDVAVLGPRATQADGLSTAIYVAGEERGRELLRDYPGYRALITRADGSRAEIA
jgi:FAD:protein FMN transferase